MPRAYYYDKVLDTNGKPIQGASVSVQDAVGNLLTLYANNNDNTTLSNPLTTDTNGAFSFFLLTAQQVTLVVTDGGFQTSKTVVTVNNTPESIFNGVGNGVTDNALALTNACLTPGHIEVPPGTYRIGSNVTVPSNVGIEMNTGAVWSVDVGVTLTINGPFTAGNSQCFAGLGSIILGTGSVISQNPKWWGALGDGANDDSTTIQLSVN